MSGPVHQWFGLTYSAYLVLPRSLLEGMPEPWQAKFVALLEEMAETYEPIADVYHVRLRGERGKFIDDPLSNYRRPSPLPYRSGRKPEGAL